MCALLGKIPTREEYLAQVAGIAGKSEQIYRYMNFDKMAGYAS